MKFTPTPHNHYWFWCVSEKGRVAISAEKELFGRWKCRVFIRADGQWIEVENYISYHAELIEDILEKIYICLDLVDEEMITWEGLKNSLPRKKGKYLEFKIKRRKKYA